MPPLAPRRPFLLSALFMFLIVLIAGGSSIWVLADPDLAASFKLIRVATTVRQVYREEVDWEQLMQAGMDGMFDQLDRYSGYVDPPRWDRMHEEWSGSYTGIGVSVLQHDLGLLIMSVRENGPAAASGIMSGDIVIGIDSTSLAGLGVFDATRTLRGPEDSEVALDIFRPVDGDTLKINVTRKKIEFVHIPFAGYTPDSAIYVRLLDFDAGASSDVRDAVDSLLNKPGYEPTGLILDLRGNPGGLFSEAYETANLFLDGGQFIVGTDGRSRWGDEVHFSDGTDILGGLPLAIIVDGGSASSSEIVAGSLHQLGRAILVGDTTFGKGLVQGFNRLHDGSALRLTISRYYLEGGLYLNEFDSALVDIGHGLAPDHQLIFSDQTAFPRALARSLLLNQFANLYQDEILASTDKLDLADDWVERFEQYAADEDFKFESRLTKQADDLVRLVRGDDMTVPTRSAAERLLNDARLDDAGQFMLHKDYIKRRLTQFAWERKHGVYAAYQKAIVATRPDIRLAGSILKELAE